MRIVKSGKEKNKKNTHNKKAAEKKIQKNTKNAKQKIPKKRAQNPQRKKTKKNAQKNLQKKFQNQSPPKKHPIQIPKQIQPQLIVIKKQLCSLQSTVRIQVVCKKFPSSILEIACPGAHTTLRMIPTWRGFRKITLLRIVD